MTEDEGLKQLALLYNHKPDDSPQFTRWQMLTAMNHGERLRRENPAPYTCKHGCERDALKDIIAGAYQVVGALAERWPDDPEITRVLDVLALGEGELLPFRPAEPAPKSGGFLSFWYKNYRGEISERTVRPICIYHGATEWHPEPQWLLEAFDMEKDAVRAFAMHDMQAPPAEPAGWEPVCISDIIRDVAELPDRDSPEDWPEAMLVTGEELRIILERYFPATPTNPERLVEAAKALVEFDGYPTEAKRPDVFRRRMNALAAALLKEGEEE